MTTLRFLLAILFATAVAQDSARFDPKRMDTTCKPCDDFYQFVNGNWLKDNPVPAAFSSWGTFDILQENNLNSLRGILEDAAKTKATAGSATQSNEERIGTFYASCM